MLHHFKGIAILVIALILVGVGAFVFFSKPTKAPSGSTASSIAQNTSKVSESALAKPVVKTKTLQFSLDKSTSEASFTIREVLRGSPNTVIGTSHEVSGDIGVDFANPSDSVIGVISIDARTLQTDNQLRDSAVRNFILHSDDVGKEYITFIPKIITGLPVAFAAGIPLSLTIAGDLTISGVTHPVSFVASNVMVSPDGVTGDARAMIKRSDYGLAIPSIPFVANVPDDLTVAIRLNARLKN